MIMFCLAANANTGLLNYKKKKYKSTINIPVDIIQIIRAIFTGTDMFFDVLLSKCLLGQRQSTNSGFNAII